MLEVRPSHTSESPWIADALARTWGSTTIVSRGVAHDAAQLPALLALSDGDVVGLATYRTAGAETELVTLEALQRRRGVGSALLDATAAQARARGCRRLWLVTTNDNLDAIFFYERRGLRCVATHRGAVDEARRTKPSIPLVGEHGIEIHDELEFELALGA